MLKTTIFKAQLELFSLSLQLATRIDKEEAKRIPPLGAYNSAQAGVELHKKFGGGMNLTLARAIAKGRPLTDEEIDKIVDFFENYQLDRADPNWGNKDNPSADWVIWLLMGGYDAWRWAKNYKTEVQNVA